MKCYGFLILRGWWLVLLILLAGAAVVGSRIPNLNVDAGTNVLLNEDDPDLAYYNRTRPLWGYDEYAIFYVTADDWFTPAGIDRLKAIRRDLKQVSYVRKVVSVLDVPLLRQEPGRTPGPFGPSFTFLGAKGCNLDRARMELTRHTQAKGNLITEDGKGLALLVYLEVPEEVKAMDAIWSRLQAESRTDPEAARRMEQLRPEMEAGIRRLRERREAMMAGIRNVAKKWSEQLPEPVRLAGVPVINVNLVEHVVYDMKVFGAAALGLFLLAFLVIYRRLRWTILPILTCLVPVLLTVGAMAASGMKVSVITSNLPVLLFVLTLPYTVYFIERYRERCSMHPDEPPGTATLEAARAIWVPCLFSCTTTMAGFASFMTSGIRPVRTFGHMMTIGMAVGLVCVFLVLPSANRPLAGIMGEAAGSRTRARGLVRLFETLTLKRPGVVLAGAALLLGVSVWGATKIHAETKFTDYFWPGSEVYEGLETIDRRLGGTTSLEIILESGKKGFFRTPEGLAALEAAARYFEDVRATGNVRSLKTLVDEIRKTYRSPKVKDASLIAMLSIFAGDLVSDFVANDFATSRIFIRMKETDPTLHRNRILQGLRKHLREQPELKGLQVRETGVFLLYANMLNTLIESQKETFAVVLAAVFLMLTILFRSPILAAVVLGPQTLPALVMLGTMGWFGIPLDLVTVMIASIAMGVGIDAAIQYTVRFQAELKVDGDRRAAVSRSHATIGRAIWIATCVIVAGFCILVLSKFVPSVYFGVFTALAMLMSQFASLTVLPSLFLVSRIPKWDKKA